jgi:hypothetical protein
LVQNKNISKTADVAITKYSAPKLKVKTREGRESKCHHYKFFQTNGCHIQQVVPVTSMHNSDQGSNNFHVEEILNKYNVAKNSN